MSTLRRAIEIATNAHEGQFDKGGAPYIGHCLRVMERVMTWVPGDEAGIAAVLHDVVEDTPITVQDLRAEEFPENSLRALDALTRREGEPYYHFVMRAAANPIGIYVKMADLFDNCNISRIDRPGPRDLRRLKKYQNAIRSIRSLFLWEELAPLSEANLSELSELLDKGHEIISDGGFLCSLCGKEAGHYFFTGRERELSYTLRSFTGGFTIPRASEGLFYRLARMVRERDVRGLFKADFENTPFYCPKCDACYCGDHYFSRPVYEDAYPYLFDYTLGRCPFGHERMLEG